MKLNVRELAIRPTMKGEVITIDITNEFVNLLYDTATTWEGHKLAHKVDEGKGEIEVNESESRIIKRAMECHELKWIYQQPIREQLGEKFE